MKILAVIMLLFTLHTFSFSQVEYSKYSDVTDITQGTPALADSLFNYISNNLPFISYDDCNNCDSRAHLIAAILEKQFPGVSIYKAWLFADYKRSSKSDEYRTKPKNHLSFNDDCSKWGYHVAPMVIIKYSAVTDTIVLDPSTQPRAVSLNKWASDLLPQEDQALLIIKDKRYRSFPDNEEGKFLDDMKEWRDDEDLTDNDFSKSINNILLAYYGFWEPWMYRIHYSRIRDLLE
jgi:hypothetical protein